MRFVETTRAPEKSDGGSIAGSYYDRREPYALVVDRPRAQAIALSVSNPGRDLESRDFSSPSYGWNGTRRSAWHRFRLRSGLRLQLAIKRLIDVFGAAFLIVIFSPLILSLAAAIRLTSRGPALFRQTRTGFHNQPFEILKFRSMYTDRCDISGVDQTVSGDPRITPIGSFIRRTNLDELPQLINVLRGDMSLVGPRPHVPGMLAAGVPYEEFLEFYGERHRMRPGITGLAQAEGLRGPTVDPEKALMRVVRDLEYIRNYSLWLDVVIVLKTVRSEFLSGNGF
jgi:lipopolysaccharide/colanic/teichoic acid biosynthesis glycosyltransferase